MPLERAVRAVCAKRSGDARDPALTHRSGGAVPRDPPTEAIARPRIGGSVGCKTQLTVIESG